ncbi:hypothetical protein BDW60DRAFT_201073 [Aspergillus nidulans var. acristatus]
MHLGQDRSGLEHLQAVCSVIRHFGSDMGAQGVVFAQKVRRQVNAPEADVQEVMLVAAFLGQATASGQGMEMQAAFCWLQ